MCDFLGFDCIQCLSDPNGWLTLFIGSLISITVPFFLYTIKPNLEILDINENNLEKCLKIKIKNNGYYSAVNLKIEAAIIQKNENSNLNYSYHLSLDRTDFLILPGKDSRKFITDEVTKSTLIATRRYNSNFENEKDLFIDLLRVLKENSGEYLRIRIHSNHEYSGFGKAIEQKFEYCNCTNKFIKIK